ncbi:Polyketide cyclase / dehydrase and lipid transport protein [Euphorbia peplus]|nr:Polyketide cyclase / dehydrase and lipid transport protein [Euphorbia peplus]
MCTFPLSIFSSSSSSYLLVQPCCSSSINPPLIPSKSLNLTSKSSSFRYFISSRRLRPSCSAAEPNECDNSDGDGYCYAGEEDGIVTQIQKLGRNFRRIRSRIGINASLDVVWEILTDYEKLADFIPSLAVSQLVQKKDKFARLYQIGQQNLPLGLKFNAKAVLDCFEKDLEIFDSMKKRDIEFKMIEGDFQLFEGKWSIEQVCKPRLEDSDCTIGQEFETTLSYSVDAKPKLWLPVHLVEGRLCKEIQTNLSSIREQAQKVIDNTLPAQ